MSQLPSHQSPPQGGSKLIIIAVIIAVAAAALNSLYLSMVRSQVEDASFTIWRLKVTKASGDKLERSEVEPIQMPGKFQDSFKTNIKAQDIDNYVGDIFTTTVPQGSFVDYGYFTDDSKYHVTVRSERRLTHLQVNPRRVPSGLSPGRYIDIYVQLPGTGGQYIPMMEYVRVIGTGHQTIEEVAGNTGRSASRNYRSISIEVLPDAVPIIARIEDVKIGDFYIVLRNETDNNLKQGFNLNTGIFTEVEDRLRNIGPTAPQNN